MDKKKKRFSLSFKQVLIIVIPLAIVALYVCFSTMYIINHLLNQNVFGRANWTNEKVEYETRLALETPIYALDPLADAVREEKDSSGISRLVQVFAKQYPQCLDYYYASAESRNRGGYFVSSNKSREREVTNHTEESWFKGAVAAKGAYHADRPFIIQPGNTMCIPYSKAIYDTNGKLKGVLGVNLVLTKLTEAVKNVEISPNSHVYAITGDGLFVTNENPEYILKKNFFETSSLNTNKYPVSEFLDGETKSFIQGKNFYSVRRLGQTSWFIVLEGPMSDYNGSISRWINIIFAVVVLLIIGCVLFNGSVMGKTNKKEHEISDRLISETQNLTVSSKETAATAQDQSAAVKEIVTTMEDNTALSEDISQKIKDVSGVAAKTNSDVTEGESFVEENVRQLQEIADTNLNTINGIKELGDKIENIWDIVSLINSVADQAKIIAFNAELEASSAGEAGKNFHIVATEIRRLADGIIDGTKEIKGKITEIQESSDALILASENGTEKIQSGVDSAKRLEERFTSIKDASEITAESAEKITTIIQQQALASEQILVTLKQIASGVENFTAATEHISKTSQTLKSIAIELGSKKQENNKDA